MRYDNIRTGVFIERPNRFTGIVEIDGRTERCHIKNTGRCKELFIKGSKVILNRSNSKNRKTEYDLIAVYKGDMLVNVDSQAPNQLFDEFLKDRRLIDNVTNIRREYRYKDSRFDFLIETSGKNIIAEIKGVTLEENGIASFPDAPTERGLRHVRELIDCISEGYEAYLVFVIQIEGIRTFTPNAKMHLDFAKAVRTASENGVNVVAFNCIVNENSMSINDPADIIFR